MTFEEWRKKHAWHVVDEVVVVFMEMAFNAGVESMKEIKRIRQRNYYQDLKEERRCVRCKRKHDGKRTQCSDCILAIKTAKARR